MSDIGNNQSRPSAADSLQKSPGSSVGKAAEALQNKVSEGAEAVKATLDDVTERAGQAYTRGNVAVTRAVDPIPSLFLVGAIGFVAGYMCSEMRGR